MTTVVARVLGQSMLQNLTKKENTYPNTTTTTT